MASAVLVLSALIAMTLAGNPLPLARLVTVVEQAIELVAEFRSPTPPDVGEALGDPQRPAMTHGVASGEVSSSSAVIWTRANTPATMYVEYAASSGFPAPRVVNGVIDPDADLTGRIVLRDLEPDAAYSYRVWLAPLGGVPTSGKEHAQSGELRTAPRADDAGALTFVFGGDLGGAGFCRHADTGYAVFDAMRRLEPTFILALGDMIYADDACRRVRPGSGSNVPGVFRSIDHPSIEWTDMAQVRPVYWQHWRYNRSDPALQRLLAATSLYGMWDDHEVLNNFGASWSHWRTGTEDRPGYRNLVTAGRDALFAYTPIQRRTEDPYRLYRSVRWGRDVELFVLDTRSYRSRNEDEDTPASAKTMLGAEQLGWIKRGLVDSRAIWKIVASSVPLSAPTAGPGAAIFGRDGWASGTGADAWSRTGFERELLDLLLHLEQQRVENLIFVGADLHQALAIRYALDQDNDGTPLTFHEFIAGPFSAAPRRGDIELDPTLNPSLLYSEGGLFNFGVVRVQPGPGRESHLTFHVRGEDGIVRPGSTVELIAR